MKNQYKNKTIKDELNIWKAKEAQKSTAAAIRFNNIATRKANIAARKAEKAGADQDAAQQLRLF